ncbi:restriction endonuclease subunit S [Campylobacter sp. P0109]|uniref:restriction endonuclease subunit S n=1 Tax=Campylobacter sp. P0109 TaxID=1895606 RepID=UPI000A341109|nr:restriction endonuclease subunit S [Campylobacter sp. P0109]
MNTNFKDSGIAWIGQIPKHWEVIRNKYVFTHKKEIVGSKFKNFDILSLTKNGIKIIVESDQKGKVPDSFETYQIVKKDDIVMCLFDLDVSAVFSGISKYSGIISPAYKIFNPKENLNFKYAGYFFDFVFVNRKFKQYSKNIRFTLGTDEFMNLKIPLPPLNEQKEIAEFLDKKCEIIDKRLSNLERKIKSLKEYKKSLISECVTKGLNPKNIEFKDSGIPWIGQIPKHWEISKIKYHGTARNGLTYSPSDLTDESGILVLRSSNVQNSKLVFHDNVYVSCSVKNNLMVKNNDILICSRNGSRNLIGKNALIDIDIKATFGAFMLIYRSKISKFMFYVLNSNIFSYHLSNFVTSTINQLTNSNFENIKFPLPPLNEQKEIAEFLDKKCEKIDRLNENYTKQITALKEYKKSLIYECVTGKKEI